MLLTVQVFLRTAGLEGGAYKGLGFYSASALPFGSFPE